MSVKSIKLAGVSGRALSIVAGVVFLLAVFFAAKWSFANVIAKRAPSKEVAELSVSMAPRDPQTHYTLAILSENTFSPEDLALSLAEFEQAVALSPNDFRLWLAYGKALERSGDAASAELALRKALKFAPSYSQVQWSLGNVLLRHGKSAEGFAEIRRAAENDQTYRLPTVTTAWQIFGGDLAAVRQLLGDSAILNAPLATFLAKQKRLDEAVEVWNALPAEDKKTVYKTEGGEILAQLTAAKKYRNAMRLQNDLSGKPAAEQFAVGKIFNGDFETDLPRLKASIFDWQVADGAQPLIGPNNEQKHGGNLSIFIIFNSSDGKDFRQISQTVAVEPAKKYVFEGFYKSNLKTASTLRWEIVDAADGKVLAAASPLAANADWTGLTIPFAVSETAEAVTLRLVREPCKSVICPISGDVRFDDFSLRQ
ncbi:MAG: hypothetical protein LH614_06655 [Pyrinomonadaceae bacterium]|nr:hypothetical protein [Pyrinomonadaceae bacterium]